MSYNEDVVWQPLQQRQELLDSWGFRCRCERCVAEESLPRSVAARVQEVRGAGGQAGIGCMSWLTQLASCVACQWLCYPRQRGHVTNMAPCPTLLQLHEALGDQRSPGWLRLRFR